MVPTPLHPLVRHLRRLAATADGQAPDARLLERFALGRDEAAFAELVRRHGGMVFGVCRRVLQHQQDAEDVFQATFLILTRKANSIQRHEALGAWLHQVAYHLAVKVRANNARRQLHERREAAMPSDEAFAEVTWRELRGLVDEELGRLPEQQRQALVLCCLEGHTHEEAARLLGWSLGTLRRRLGQGRELLRTRLVRRGLTLSAALVTSLTTQGATPVPAALLDATVEAAVTGTVAPQVATLVEGGLGTLFGTKLKSVTAVLLLIGLLAGGAVVIGGTPAESRNEGQPMASATNDLVPLSGRVLDPDEKPHAGARLYLAHRPKASATVEVVRLGTTDEAGRFRVEVSRIAPGSPTPTPLIATADGFGLDWVEIKDPPPRDLTLRLVQDVPVRGRVLSRDGKPVAGVSVGVIGITKDIGKFSDLLAGFVVDAKAGEIDVSYKLTAPLYSALRITGPDKEGRFQITGLGADRLIGVELRSPTMAPARLPVLTSPRRDLGPVNKAIAANFNVRSSGPGSSFYLLAPTFEHVTQPPRVIEGTVREADGGKPVAGATVRASSGDSEVVTNAEGRYCLVGLRKVRKHIVTIVPSKDSPLMETEAEGNDMEGPKPIRVDVALKRRP
jgi:RNA polymerase sigma factor (sigma-70 family)